MSRFYPDAVLKCCATVLTRTLAQALRFYTCSCQLAQGLDPEEARRQARLALGGPEQVKEECRDARRTRGLEDLLQDMRYGVRMLLKNPGFTILSTLALAFGIGANTAIFSIVDAVILRPLEFKDPDRLVVVWERSPRGERMSASVPNFLDWKERNKVFDEMAARRQSTLILSGGEQPREMFALQTTSNYFSMVGVKLALGRAFLPDEDQPGKNRVVILNHRLWENVFNSDPAIVGKAITLNHTPYTVVGVLMPDSVFDRVVTELYIPLDLTPYGEGTRDSHFLQAWARLKPEITIEQAQAHMETIAARLGEQYPKTNQGCSVNLVPIRNQIVGSGLQQTVLLLFSAVGLTLLISCVSVANMALSASAARQKEVAIRSAFGARRGRLVRQFLTESIFLAILGGAGGILLSYWLMNFIVKLLPALPAETNPTIDYRVLVFTLGISLLTGVSFGMIPALLATKPDLNNILKEGGRGATTGLRRHRIRRILVISELALALILLVGAGLLVRSYWRVLQVNLGFEPQNVLKMRFTLPEQKYPEGNQFGKVSNPLLSWLFARRVTRSRSLTPCDRRFVT